MLLPVDQGKRTTIMLNTRKKCTRKGVHVNHAIMEFLSSHAGEAGIALLCHDNMDVDSDDCEIVSII